MTTTPQQPTDFTEMDAADGGFGALLRSGGTLGSAQGVTPRECEALYQLGHGHYAQGRYSDAFKVFSLLLVYNHLEPRYLLALGGAAQMLGRYADALQHYATATLAALDDPRPPLHSAECLIAMGRLPEAAQSLQLAIALAGDAHPVVKARAETLLAPLGAAA
jgi:type III secretion system low calcium response chaperone LcrH/SycD